MSRVCIFGYGSLLNRTSVEKALQRDARVVRMTPAVLRGFTRTWRAKELVLFEGAAAPQFAVFLDLRVAPEHSVNGVLIGVTERELAQLRSRERNYDCVDVTAHVDGVHECARVFTFVCKAEHRADAGEAGLAVPARYVELVRQGCAALGPDFCAAYERSTDAPRFPLQAGAYAFLDPDQARYV
jgi:cation transport regulator ChaC